MEKKEMLSRLAVVSDERGDKTATVGTTIGTTIVSAGLMTRRSPALLAIKGSIVGHVFPIHDRMIIGRGNKADIRVEGTRISRRHAEIFYSGESVMLRDLGSTNGTFHNGAKLKKPVALKEGDKIRIGGVAVLRFTYLDPEDEAFQKKLFESATRDALTGAYNRKYLFERLDAELAFTSRHGGNVSFVMFDIDYFKKINDTHGHQAGDLVLMELSKVVFELARNEDVFGRYGGEEFAVILRGVSAQGAWIFAERLRSAVEKTVFTFASIQIPVTISVGVVASVDGNPAESTTLIQMADKYLYQSKHEGRNRVSGQQLEP